jgi:hypothetical protein
MIWHSYQLDDSVLKTSDSLVLLKTERGLVEIGKDGLAVAVKLDGKVRGYVLQGHCKLALDTIVETREGAIGKPIEKEVKKPFLALGSSEELQRGLGTTNDDDLKRMGYENPQQFLTEAKELLNHFSQRRMGYCNCSHDSEGSIFAFPNEAGRVDILFADGSKLVYKAVGMIFIADGNKTVLRSPEHVIVSDVGKCLTIRT